ncbi:Clavaminate synthase-like protein [Serendipita vermifera]|nr:Clavaminate synthase-like protein [Serendipita vermifera]
MALSLPLIDISSYFDRSSYTDQDRQNASESLHKACRDFGFFYLKLEGFATEEEMKELTDLGREFFHLEQEKKDEIRLANEDGARGYQRLKENVTMGKADNHEGIDFYKPVANPDKTKPLWGTNQWTKHVPSFQEKYEAWIQKMLKLGLIVMEAMAVGLGMSEEEWQNLRSKVDDSFWVMRIIGYPPLPPGYDGFSCGAHKDYGCLTFLYADPTPAALQVFLGPDTEVAKNAIDASLALPPEQGDAEGVWINADPLPGAVVCNIGEMWETWTCGLYRSTLHRVIHRSSNYRVSVPFFFEPNFDALVEPLPAALRRIEEEKSDYGSAGDQAALRAKYPPVVYGEFLKGKVGGNFTEGSQKQD